MSKAAGEGVMTNLEQRHAAHSAKLQRLTDAAEAVTGCAVRMNALSESVGRLEMSRLRAALADMKEVENGDRG